MKYNAFISYKHAPEDNAVADAVHKGLEHFHIPGKIRKKTGIKKINRIFRDKAELPITMDLTDNISDALVNSDYLIVLCSTNTKESAWVPREIEAFLETHTKRDVFTVLINGEPQDVIPEILQYEERVVTDENGKEQTVRVPIEPLSCDYRIGLRQAKKSELPRLAAGLIGCAYDELINRRRQYRMRRLTAAFSLVLAVVLAFAGYMYYSRDKINQNYMESLKNQSKYLANESGILLEKGKRITALQLALEALPKDDEDDRPVTAEAVKALTDATLAYEGKSDHNTHAAWNYKMPNPVMQLQLSEDKKHIAIRDEGSVIGVWDTQTHEKTLYLEDMDERIIGIAFPDDANVFLWTSNTVYCYDVNSGEKRWEYVAEGDTLESNSGLAAGQTYIFPTGKNRYLELEVSSGKLKSDITVPGKPGYEDFGIVESVLSPDKKRIAFRGLVGWNDYACGVMDIASKNAVFSEVIPETIKNIAWVDADTIAIASTKIDSSVSSTVGSSDIISTDRAKVTCISASDLKEKWNADFVCNGVMLNSGFVPLGNDAIAYFSGNVITVYDRATGQEKYTNNVNDSVIDVSDTNGDGQPLYITENGGYAVPALSVDKDAVYYSKFFTDNLRQVAIGGGVYVRQASSNEVIYYGISVYDEAWTPLNEDIFLSGDPNRFCMDQDTLAVLSDAAGPVLDIFGLKEGGAHAQCRLDGGDLFKYRLLGIYQNRVYLGYKNGAAFDLVSVDTSGKDMKSEELFKGMNGTDEPCTMSNGKVVYSYKNDSFKSILVIYDQQTGEKKETELPEDIGIIMTAPVYDAEGKTVSIYGETTYLIDTESGTAGKVETPDGWAGALCVSDKGVEGVYALSDEKHILLADKSGKVSVTINCPGVKPVGMTFVGDELLVLYDDGSLYHYAKEDGRFVKKTDIFFFCDSSGKANFHSDIEHHLMYIQVDDLVCIIDEESGTHIAHIGQCFGYYPDRDILVTFTKEGKKYGVGYYKRYSVEQLIEKARDILKNASLSDETKSRYGINMEE